LGIGWEDFGGNPPSLRLYYRKILDKGVGIWEEVGMFIFLIWKSILRCQNIQKSNIQFDSEFFGGH
jgi:hypothetical protein